MKCSNFDFGEILIGDDLLVMTLLPPGCQLPHAGVQVERVRQPPRAVPHQDVRPRQRPSWG